MHNSLYFKLRNYILSKNMNTNTIVGGNNHKIINFIKNKNI